MNYIQCINLQLSWQLINQYELRMTLGAQMCLKYQGFVAQILIVILVSRFGIKRKTKRKEKEKLNETTLGKNWSKTHFFF